MTIVRRFALAALAWLLVVDGYAAELVVESLWVREGPPNAKTLAAYGKVTNASDKPVTIADFASSDFQRVELHQSHFDHGMVRMSRITEVVLAPGQSLDLAPESRHLMLIAPTRPWREGDVVNLQLRLQNGETVTVSATVRRDEETAPHHGEHHQH